MSQRLSALTLYIGSISIIGILLNLYGIWSLLPVMGATNFWLLIGLAVVATIATTSVGISEKAGLTYHITEAVGLASAMAFGVFAGVVISAVVFLVAWATKPRTDNWKKNLRQLAFNISMDSIAAGIACAILVWGQQQLAGAFWLFQFLPWFLAAFALDTINIMLLVLVLRLQHGPDFNVLQSWQEMQWSSGLNILIAAVGGWIMAYAITYYDWRGILAFFFPILLSAYAFRLYITKVRDYMENLESMVDERTADLAQRTEELAAMNRQKDTFLTVLTHDMITPLTSIGVCTEMLDGKAAGMPDIASISHLIMRNQRVLINLAHNIMDIEKLQAGVPLYLEKEPISMRELIQESMSLMRPEAQAKDVELSYEFCDDPLIIEADRQQMQRILLNLISNAVKYTPEKGAAWVRATLDKEQFLLEVEDTGYGIAPDELPNIFERFMRASQMRSKITGTGIGLAIVKSLVQAHDGQIDVSSALNVGTKFMIYIPRGHVE